MAIEFKLPDIGEGLTEGEITKWLVKEGDAVGADQPMVEVLTDKATVEITSPRAGTIQKILVPDGTKVPVGTVIVVIGDGAAGKAPAGGAPAAKPAAGHAPAPAPAAKHAAGKAPAPAAAPAPARGEPAKPRPTFPQRPEPAKAEREAAA